MTKSRNLRRVVRPGGLVALLLGFVLLAAPWTAVVTHAATTPASQADWAMFKARFITSEGRVIDNDQGGISHSEGQGYGMLLATYYGDRRSFDLLLSWTEKSLRRPGDHLFAWRFVPDAGTAVSDLNNATDGDLHIAWALARAAETWREPAYMAKAVSIAADILRLCVMQHQGRLVLLPGNYGFRHRGGIVLNLSYYAFAAFRELARVMPDPKWQQLETDGLAIMRTARFGPLSLPPDWLLITSEGEHRPADGWPARFSYAADRIPLNLSWAHLHEPALDAALALWTSPTYRGRPPAWVNLNLRQAADDAVGPGVRAIMEVSAAEAQARPAKLFPAMKEATDYYQATLLLLAKMAVEQPVTPPRPETDVALTQRPPVVGVLYANNESSAHQGAPLSLSPASFSRIPPENLATGLTPRSNSGAAPWRGYKLSGQAGMRR